MIARIEFEGIAKCPFRLGIKALAQQRFAQFPPVVPPTVLSPPSEFGEIHLPDRIVDRDRR